MKLPRKKLIAVLAKKLEDGKLHEPAVAQEIAAYLLESGRRSELNSILRDLIAYRAKQRGFYEIGVSSAHPLDSQLTKDIESLVKALFTDAKKLALVPRIDSTLLGGVTLQFPDAQLDLSLRAKLRQLRALTKTGVQHG